MKMNSIKSNISYIIILLSIAILQTNAGKTNPWTTAMEIIKKEGYPYEEYTFQTSDGYLLTNFRIPGNKAGRFNPNLYPVALFHGMATSGKDYLLIGNRSLAFLLADAGHDVWLPNMRFTEFARHANISKDDKRYWDFGVEENAAIDVTETINEILRINGANKIIHIGLSYGNPLYIAMCNLKPEMAKKVAAQVTLGPAYYASNYKPMIQTFESIHLLDILMGLGHQQFTVSEDVRRLAVDFCENPLVGKICYKVLFSMIGADWENIDWDTTAMLFGRTATYVLKQYKHLFQVIATGELKKYDYGIVENIKRYGSPKPPMYNMKACTAPMMIYYGQNDLLANDEDMKKLLTAFEGSTNKIYARSPELKTFNHGDFIIGAKATDAFYVDLLAFLKTI